MVSISLCMIVKNEEDVICRCLDCVKNIVDEIIIVDTGSTDDTKNLASKYTGLIYDFAWIDDFAAARNFSFSKATKDYILWLDADDIIDKKNQKKLLKLKRTLDKKIDVVKMKYNSAYDEHGKPTFTFERERLIKRAKNFRWVGEIHETIEYYTNDVIHTDIEVSHKKLHPTEPKRNLNIFKKMLSDGKIFNARQQYYYARELYYNKLDFEAIIEFNKFLERDDGWKEDKIDACKLLSYCYDRTKQYKLVLQTLFRSFDYDVPRAEICCEIGKKFMDKSKYDLAIFWYELAISFDPSKRDGFIDLDCYNYIPYLQLCVCHYNLGHYKRAIRYNEKAGEIKPKSRPYLYNKKFFEENSLDQKSE